LDEEVTRDPHIELVLDEEGFRRLRSLWDEVLFKADHRYPFQSYEWCKAWWDAFGAGNQLRILVVFDGPLCLGICPLYLKSVGPFKQLAFLCPDRSDYLDFIARGGVRDIVIGQVLSYLASRADDWDLFVLNNICWSDKEREFFLAAAKKNGLEVASRAYTKSPYIHINMTWDEYLAATGKKKRVRKKERRILRGGDIEVVHFKGSENDKCGPAENLFEEAKSIERRTWKYIEGNPRLQGDCKTEQFFQDVFKSFMKRGWLDLWFALVGGTPRAYAFSFVFDNKVFAYNSGYDNSFSRYRLGSLLLINRIRDAFENKLEEYDFLRGEEEYKFEWTNNTRRINEYVLFNRRISSAVGARILVKMKWSLARSALLKNLRYKIKTFLSRRGMHSRE